MIFFYWANNKIKFWCHGSKNLLYYGHVLCLVPMDPHLVHDRHCSREIICNWFSRSHSKCFELHAKCLKLLPLCPCRTLVLLLHGIPNMFRSVFIKNGFQDWAINCLEKIILCLRSFNRCPSSSVLCACVIVALSVGSVIPSETTCQYSLDLRKFSINMFQWS